MLMSFLLLKFKRGVLLEFLWGRALGIKSGGSGAGGGRLGDVPKPVFCKQTAFNITDK